ncbi:MAG: acetate kinase [Gammaproteobacteria bacterium]|nr:acetate kinase [Gammaproteobacteria bacterium]
MASNNSNEKNILVLNCGSSSLKFAVINSESTDLLLSGIAERLNQSDASITTKINGTKNTEALGEMNSHLHAIKQVGHQLKLNGLIDTIYAVGHRVVHGGESFTQSVLIDQDVINAIQETSGLAPLHNPANLTGIKAATELFPNLPQIAVFDTAFHQTMPEHAYLYAIDKTLYQQHGIRRYGFHGTSHYFVSREAANVLNKPIEQTSVITVHLGNGCSICAVENGQSVDTSLGLTPVEGLVMGTRSGDVDPGLIIYLQSQHQYSTEDIDELLNKKSGLLGLSQISNDCRTLEEALDSDNEATQKQAQLALDVFCYRVSKYVASYTCALSHLDAIVFTGGIGENSDYIRKTVVERLNLMGLFVDEQKNIQARFGQGGEIQSENSNVKILVVPTNEELVIAQDAARLASAQVTN